MKNVLIINSKLEIKETKDNVRFFATPNLFNYDAVYYNDTQLK